MALTPRLDAFHAARAPARQYAGNGTARRPFSSQTFAGGRGRSSITGCFGATRPMNTRRWRSSRSGVRGAAGFHVVQARAACCRAPSGASGAGRRGRGNGRAVIGAAGLGGSSPRPPHGGSSANSEVHLAIELRIGVFLTAAEPPKGQWGARSQFGSPWVHRGRPCRYGEGRCRPGADQLDRRRAPGSIDIVQIGSAGPRFPLGPDGRSAYSLGHGGKPRPGRGPLPRRSIWAKDHVLWRGTGPRASVPSTTTRMFFGFALHAHWVAARDWTSKSADGRKFCFLNGKRAERRREFAVWIVAAHDDHWGRAGLFQPLLPARPHGHDCLAGGSAQGETASGAGGPSGSNSPRFRRPSAAAVRLIDGKGKIRGSASRTLMFSVVLLVLGVAKGFGPAAAQRGPSLVEHAKALPETVRGPKWRSILQGVQRHGPVRTRMGGDGPDLVDNVAGRPTGPQPLLAPDRRGLVAPKAIG